MTESSVKKPSLSSRIRHEGSTSWNCFSKKEQDVGSEKINGMQMTKRDIEWAKKKAAVIKGRIQNLRVAVILGFVVFGLTTLIVALILPEWFILKAPGDIEGHIGYFRRCMHSTTQNTVVCSYEIIAETAAPIAMYLISILSAFGAIFSGIRRMVTTSCRPSMDDARSSTYQRMRGLILLSGISCTCGLATFTYLYNSYILPVGVSYVLGWIASALLLIGGIVGYCFGNPFSTQANSAVSPMPHQPCKTSWQQEATSDSIKGNSPPPSIVDKTVDNNQ